MKIYLDYDNTPIIGVSEDSGIEQSETNDGVLIRIKDIPKAINWLEQKQKEFMELLAKEPEYIEKLIKSAQDE